MKITLRTLGYALLAAISVACAVALLQNPAFATNNNTYVEENGNAISICKGALPAYESLIRQRPLAMVNESERPAYVNCGFRAPTNAYGQKSFAVRLKNFGNSGVTVRCTGVIGVEDNASYTPRSTYLAPGQTRTVSWSKSDNNGHYIRTNTGLQCYLPPHVGMTELPQVYYTP